jgi:hypothetical protein
MTVASETNAVVASTDRASEVSAGEDADELKIRDVGGAIVTTESGRHR